MLASIYCPTVVPGLGPPIYCAAFACLVSAQLSGRTGPAGKKRAIMFLLPFCFSAALGTVYQLTAQADLNCYPSKLIDCEAPPYSVANATACGGDDAYFGCVYSSGCWKNAVKNDCLAAERLVGGGCDLACHEGDAKFETTVDLSGFDMGPGAYRKLFGVNVVSAVGALGLFIFACFDDVLEWQFKRAASAATALDIETALGKGLNGEHLMTAI